MLALRHTLRRSNVISRRSVAIPAAELAAQKSGDYSSLDRVEDWQNFKMPFAPYEGMGPVNPPLQEIPVEQQTRMIWFPETYFKAMESKLGYSGGYSFIWGMLALTTSNQLIVAQAPEFLWFMVGSVVIGNLLKYGLFPWLDRENHQMQLAENARIQQWKEYKLSLAESEVDGIARLKEQAEGLNLIQEQRKTNIDLALKAEFMNRQADLTAAVKQRLDYQVALKNAEREAQSAHMIKWIESEVASAIAKRDSASDLKSAIAQLKAIGAK